MDGWASRRNAREGINIEDPRTAGERSTVAGQACSMLRLPLPCLVDTMDDSVNKTYAAWPDRLYVIDRAGRIAVMGQPGPRGFAPSLYEAQDWLRANAR